MHILLINVPIRLHDVPVNFPTGLGIIASVLEKRGHHISVIDINAHRYSEEDVMSLCTKAEADVIGISGLISTYKYQLKLISELKKSLPQTPVISGGGCATSVPHLLMEYTPVDFLVIGEGENTIVELIDAIEQKQQMDLVQGIAFRSDDKYVVTDTRPLEKDLDTFPMPAYHLFPTEIYRDNPIWSNYPNSMNIIATRGCPMDCHFCYNVFGKRSYRKRSKESIMEEVRFLKDTYDIEFVGFVDDNLTIHKKHLLEVCEALEKENITWGCHGRVDTTDEERLDAMKKSGCVWLGFGIESGSQKILKNMNKKITVQQAKDAIRKTREYGIFPNTTFILGYPGETIETIRESIQFKIDMEILHSSFFATPYPGTQLWEEAKIRGLIGDEHEFVMSLNDATDFIVNFTDIPDDELVRIRKRSFEELRIVFYFKHKEITKDTEAKFLANADKLLKQEFLLPAVKGHILMGLARFYQRNSNLAMADQAKTAAQSFGVET